METRKDASSTDITRATATCRSTVFAATFLSGPSYASPSAGTREALEKILKAIRKRFGKQVKVIVRADSGFCRNELLSWIEQQPNVHYCIGLARNQRLEKLLEPTFTEVLEELGYHQLVQRAQAEGSNLPEISELEGSARRFAG